MERFSLIFVTFLSTTTTHLLKVQTDSQLLYKLFAQNISTSLHDRAVTLYLHNNKADNKMYYTNILYVRY